jgi:hypothetical protein
MSGSTQTWWGAKEEFAGQMSMKIGDKTYQNINTTSITRHTTPLVLDLDGDGLDLSSHTDGVTFDLTGDGVRDQTAWTSKQNSFDDAFLVLDSNHDGQVNSGKELFGDQNGADNGFDELAKHDTNKDGVINQNDAIYKDLKLWADIDADGVVDEGEMKSLAEMGLKSINTNFSGKAGDVTDEHGNDISMKSSFTRELNGQITSGTVTDALFINKDADAQNLADITAILMKKMGNYSQVVGFHNQTVGLDSIEDDDDNSERIRLSAQAASKESQRIALNNELDTIEQEMAQLNSELNSVDDRTNNITIASNNNTPQNNKQNSNNSENNPNSNNNSTQNNSNNDNNQENNTITTSSNKTDLLRNSLSSLQDSKLNIIARIAKLN